MVYIDSAYFGDEKGYRKITENLLSKITFGTLDVTADEKLIPAFEVSEKTELDSQDEKRIRTEAVKQCGESDQNCLEATKARLRSGRLKEKENEQGLQNVIKGRRLTVNVIDDKGKRKQMIVPDGQKFKLENVTGVKPSKGGMGLPSVNIIQERAWSLLGFIFVAFVYVFGIAMSYTTFMRESEIAPSDAQRAFFQALAWGSGITSILLAIFTSPLWGWMVGYIIVLMYFGFKAFIAEYIAKPNVSA